MLAEEVADLLHAITRRLRHAARGELRDVHVTPAQWRALQVIAWCDEPLRMSEIADRLHIARRSATGVVDELEEAGLVQRADDPRDRRAVVVEATQSGRRLLSAAGDARRRAAARELDALTPAELTRLAGLLRRLAGA